MLSVSRILLAFLALLPLASNGWSQSTESASIPDTATQPRKIYVVPVQGDIDASIIYVIRRGVKAALDNHADALILHMDTYGGQVKITQEITDILRKFHPQSETYTYIDTKAISAGAYISSATRHIYMAPGSVIGAATPVMLAPGGTPQQMGASYEEKIKSALKALVRANAELNGHNPVVFDAMIDRDQGLTIGDETVVEPGKILTLTSKEAEKTYGTNHQPLLSSGTVASLDELITRIGGTPETTVIIKPTGAEQIAKFLLSISPFLIAGALLLGYIEFKTPGFGFFGVSGIILALLFFFGHYIAGISGQEYVLLLFIGIALIAIELFLVPGTVVAGLTGLLLVAISLVLAMTDLYPNESWLPSMSKLQPAMFTLGQAILLLIAGVLTSIYFLPKTRAFRHLVLEATLPDKTAAITHTPPPVEIGAQGIAITPLHPGGKIEINGIPIDAFTEGGYLPGNTPVRVIAFKGSQALVEKT